MIMNYCEGSYTCPTCDYIYNPEKGDPMGSIPPGTQFVDLSIDWVCPACGTDKDKFIKSK